MSNASAGLVDRVQERLAEEFDAVHGGFGFVEDQPRKPKFPEPSNLFFLLHRAEDSSLDESIRREAEAMLTRTLDKMAAGGLQDHLGGGFHRYSVDRFWAIPHFEKMLYDNGQLASVYARAFGLTGKMEYRWVTEDLLDWASREMLADEGAFFAAIDADSEGEEGAFYRWSKDQMKPFANLPSWETFAKLYQLSGTANFEDAFYVPQTIEGLAERAAEMQLDAPRMRQSMAKIREAMRIARDERERPGIDTKILTSWNGLMIAGFADAGRILQREDAIDIAKRAATFILTSMRQSDGSLYRTYASVGRTTDENTETEVDSQGKAKLNGYLDDYAMLVYGLIALHRATGEANWLQSARELTDLQIKKFWDQQRGGFFFTSDDHQSLIARAKDPVDGAIPSGNSVAALNLLYLADEIETKNEYQSYAQRTLETVAGLLQRSPASAPLAAVAISELLSESNE
ncbi:MAG: hypothetical protein R3C05_13640 [Pirellulaceae bacterium]